MGEEENWGTEREPPVLTIRIVDFGGDVIPNLYLLVVAIVVLVRGVIKCRILFHAVYDLGDDIRVLRHLRHVLANAAQELGMAAKRVLVAATLNYTPFTASPPTIAATFSAEIAYHNSHNSAAKIQQTSSKSTTSTANNNSGTNISNIRPRNSVAYCVPPAVRAICRAARLASPFFPSPSSSSTTVFFLLVFLPPRSLPPLPGRTSPTGFRVAGATTQPVPSSSSSPHSHTSSSSLSLSRSLATRLRLQSTLSSARRIDRTTQPAHSGLPKVGRRVPPRVCACERAASAAKFGASLRQGRAAVTSSQYGVRAPALRSERPPIVETMASVAGGGARRKSRVTPSQHVRSSGGRRRCRRLGCDVDANREKFFECAAAAESESASGRRVASSTIPSPSRISRTVQSTRSAAAGRHFSTWSSSSSSSSSSASASSSFWSSPRVAALAIHVRGLCGRLPLKTTFFGLFCIPTRLVQWGSDDVCRRMWVFRFRVSVE